MRAPAPRAARDDTPSDSHSAIASRTRFSAPLDADADADADAADSPPSAP